MNLLVCVLMLITTGVAHAEKGIDEMEHVFDEALKKRGLGADDAKKAEAAEIDAAYKEALKQNKCEKQFALRYELGEKLQSLARKTKLSVYDLVLGEDLPRQNLNKLLLMSASTTYQQYAQEMPEVFTNKFNQEFKTDALRVENERTVLNTSVQRDFECFKKAKK